MNLCLTCDNPTQNPKFCSKSCAAKLNNQLYPKRQPEHPQHACMHCGELTRNTQYCSRSCTAKARNSARYNSTTSLLPAEVQIPGICLACQKPTTNAKYCSSVCDHKHHCIMKVKAGMASTKTLKLYLIYTVGRQCSICGLDRWNQQDMPIELDHIDGNPDNNLLSNLRLICPNCHAQTSTYKNKNRGHGRAFRRARYHAGKSY